MTDSTDLKPRKLWKILFGVSLALNLLIVGALGGALMRKGKGPTANHPASGFLYMRALDFQDKRALRKEILRNKDGRKLIRARNQSSFSSAVDILKSNPFDRTAFENLVDENRLDELLLFQLKRPGDGVGVYASLCHDVLLLLLFDQDIF